MTLEQELKAEHVAHLDLSGYCQAAGDVTVKDVLNKMYESRQNVCLIIEENKLVGIFTDRDVLRKVVAFPETWNKPVSQFMTTNPITVKPETSAADALWLMDDHHFRNLPVVSDAGEIIGTMTHLAVIEFLAARYPIEILNRPPRPDQFPSHAEGG